MKVDKQWGARFGKRCPTPRKRAFGSLPLAVNRAMSLTAMNKGTQFRAYECRCGFAHLTNDGKKK